jgi:hypothetical protein
MGVGIVLAFGMLIQSYSHLKRSVYLFSTEDILCQYFHFKKWTAEPILWFVLTLYAIGLGGMIAGLINSYSRGAWLGTVLGLSYLIVSGGKLKKTENGTLHLTLSPPDREVGIFACNQYVSWLKKNQWSVFVIILSVLVLAFWQFRFSECLPVQRAFSVTNANDFSWRNRVTAWKGAMRMMVDRPLLGFGWGRAESVYRDNYCPLDESAAIETNDFLMIGISAGVPAMVCFLVYIALCFRSPKPKVQSPKLGIDAASDIGRWAWGTQTTCRAGVIVLLVGFWFDGGLFKLFTGCVFWMLIEMGRMDWDSGNQAWKAEGQNATEASAVRHPPSATRSSKYLRWLVGFLAALALIQSTFYLGTPLLPVNEQTLAIARKYLVPPKEESDFACLAAQPIWQGQKLKVLLDHVELANYNRELVNWQVDDKIYQNYVLSPIINPSSIIHHPSADFAWRRLLWEEFYPRIRHESSPDDVAQIVLKHLHERVKIAALPNSAHDMPTIWRKQITDEAGFENIYVAALRSVGVPARLDADGHVEFWDGNQWQPAPKPSVLNK